MNDTFPEFRDRLRGTLFVLVWLALALAVRAERCGARAAPAEADFGARAARAVAAR
jgi:hypothetical protein